MLRSAPSWQPEARVMERVDRLILRYRGEVLGILGPLVRAHHPELLEGEAPEYRKMVELSTKMSLVGHACTEVLGEEHDARRVEIGALFGACCFLADSFIDDFGEEATQEYLERFERLLTEGWFEVRNERERLLYVTLSRLFTRRDVLRPTLRQAIQRLFEAQSRDVALRFAGHRRLGEARRRHLRELQQCARDRSGHAITVLAAFLVPRIPLRRQSLIFSAGALIMYIDDHGDHFTDLREGRLTYMNQVSDPVGRLRRIFRTHVERLHGGLPAGPGRDLLIGFLTRYFVTRMKKHKQQRKTREPSWAVYE